MMYILLLIYFVNKVTGDDSSETKYIDLLPEKEKEEFLETVARRIFNNIKHKNDIPERDEHNKLIEKVLKEESLNLKRISQNTPDDSGGKGNVAGDYGDALDLVREGKRDKRYSLKKNDNSDIVRIQQASKETNEANVNEISKELGVSDTEDIEVKPTNNTQTGVNSEEMNKESNGEGIGTEITVEYFISKENSSVRDDKSNYDQEGKTTKRPPTTSEPEKTRYTNEVASERIETTKTPEHLYSPIEIINITSRKNGNSKPINYSFEKDTKQEPVAITVITSLSTSPDEKIMEQTSEEALKNNETKILATNADIKLTKSEETDEAFENAIQKTVTTSPKINTTETITKLSEINEIRKAYDKLDPNFDTIKLDNIRDDRDNQDTKGVPYNKTLTTKTVVTASNVKLDDNYFDDESSVAAVDKNVHHTSLNDSAIKENYEPVTENIKSTNSVTESENNDTKSSESNVNGTENNYETIKEVIKNSEDYIKKKHSIKETSVNSYNITALENNTSSMAQNSHLIVKSNIDMITTTTMGTLINSNKEIKIENSTEKPQNKSNGITDGIPSETSIKSYKMGNDLDIVNTSSKVILIEEIKNNTAAVPKINNNKKAAKYEGLVTESINITIKHDNFAEKNKSNSDEIRQHKYVFENNTIENNEGTTSEKYIETTTVKIETLTVTTDLNKSEANDEDFRIKEDAKPYINQDKISEALSFRVSKTNQESVTFSDNKMEKHLEKMEKISATFVNDMIKVIRASFSDKPNEDLKTLRSLNDNPEPKEYKVYKAPNNEPLDQNYGAEDDKVIEENPYYVPVYNYGPEHAYYNPKNRLGPNVDDDDIKIIKNDGFNVESIAQDYDSLTNDNGYNENDYTRNYNQQLQESNDNDARNDVDYDEAYNKEKEFIDRMGDKKGNYIFTPNESLRGKATENTQKLKKVEYMKNLVKTYKNRHGKNGNRQRNLSKYKLNLPIVINYPKYSDIIMNSHDYLDVDYRYPKWNKPKNSHRIKHRILRKNGNEFPSDLITRLQKTEKPLKDHYGKPNSINLFESGEYVWETEDTKDNTNKKQMEDKKSLGVKNQIQKIREMMYSSANFGFKKPTYVEKKNDNILDDFIKKVPKMCDGEDPSCVEPFFLIYSNHILNTKQHNSARHAMNNSISSDYFIARKNNISDFVVDYVPKLSARTKQFKFDNFEQLTDHIKLKWITDFSEIRDKEDITECSFCSYGVCHICGCGNTYIFCKISKTRSSNYDKNNKNDDDMITAIDNTEPTDKDIAYTTVGWYTVKNISMLPSYLDPILKIVGENTNKQRYKKYRFMRTKYDKSLDAKPNYVELDSSEELKDLKSIDTKQNHQLTSQNRKQSEETSDAQTQTQNKKYLKIKTVKSIMEIVPDDVEIMLKVADMLEKGNSEEKDIDIDHTTQFLRSAESIDLESYVSVLQDMVRNEVSGLLQYDWMGTSIDIQAAIFKLKEMTESVKNNEVLDNLDFKLLKYFTFLHKFSIKRNNDLRMFLPKPKYRYNRTRSQKGVYSRTWLKRRLKQFAFEVSGTDLYYFMDFLEDLQFYLYDLHSAVTQIALVTSYKNQNWFKNLTDLYLDTSRKNILELLLHLTTVRLLDLVENSIQTGIKDGFIRYVINNEKEIEKSKNELVLIIRIIEELKKEEWKSLMIKIK